MTEPGWYTDPRDSSQYRYWDGTSWTEAVAPGAAAESFASGGETTETEDHASAATSVSDAADGVASQFENATDHLDAASGQLDQAGSQLTDRLGGAADGAGSSVAAAFESAASATPLDNPSALADSASGAIQEKAASAIPIDSSAGLSVDEALLDLNPADAVGNVPSLDGLGGGKTLDGIGQGISVDDVLSDVETPFNDAAETMVVDVPDFSEAPELGEVGIPGDGMSFSSPIDTFGGADETAVIPNSGLPLADPDAPQHTDRFSAPPPTPSPTGLETPSAMPTTPGFGQEQDLVVPTPGFATPPGGAAPPGGFDGPPPTQFGQPGPGGPGFEPGAAAAFGDPATARAMPAAAPSKSKTPWIVLGGIGLAIVAVLAFLALRSPERTSVDAIAEGQCFADFNQFEATEIRSSVSSADCVEEHALEVFEVTDAPYAEFSEYPGEQVITDLAFRHCLNGFEEFVGTTYEESTLDVWALYPTEGSWNLNSDREVVCMVGAFDQTLTTGTLEGSGR